MHRNKRRNEGVLYEAPNTRSKIHNEVKEELAGTETFFTDAQGLRLAYESPDGLYQNGSILYIAGTKSAQDVWDDLKLPFHKTRLTQRYKDANKHIQQNEGITDIISHSLGSAVSAQLNQDYEKKFRTRSYGAPHWSSQRTEDFGTNLRIRGKNDVISAFDNAPIAVDKGGGLDFLSNHSFEGMADVKNKPGNIPLTTEEFLQEINSE